MEKFFLLRMPNSLPLNKAKKRLKDVLGEVPELFLFVVTNIQKLFVFRKGVVVLEYPVSTAENGIGNREDSLQTPPGIHCIKEKYGHGAPIGRIFVDREDTHRDWKIGTPGENLILTRILRLEGLEEGINKGAGIDSYERYIYIHGTNREHLIGQAMSQGCICMKNADVIHLFERVREGTIVVID